MNHIVEIAIRRLKRRSGESDDWRTRFLTAKDDESWQEVYNEYLGSSEWQERREARFAKDDWSCLLCGSDQDLECHHRHYKRVGDEDIGDLATLCKSCHTKYHE